MERVAAFLLEMDERLAAAGDIRSERKTSVSNLYWYLIAFNSG